MSSVVFLRGINVGGANVCRPAEIARKLKKFEIVNIGAVGTFVVRAKVKESALRSAIAGELPFKCEVMICPARDILRLAAEDPFAGQPAGPEITRFVSVAAKAIRSPLLLPLSFPSEKDWLLKVLAIQGQLVVGLYYRDMKAIGYLGKLDKQIGVPITTRNWNTMEKVVKVIGN